MAVFDANWFLESVEADVPSHHVYVGTVQSPAERSEFYPAAAVVIRKEGWAIREGDPGDAKHLPDQIMRPESGILATDQPGIDATQSVRMRITDYSRTEGLTITLDVVGGERALALGDSLQDFLGYEGLKIRWQEVVEGSY